MENEEQFFVKKVSESPSDINGEVTILLDEDGKMILDITQTLSNLEQSQEGSSHLVIITDESNSLSNSIIYDVLPENGVEDHTLHFQNEVALYAVDDVPPENTILKEPVTISNVTDVN